ncbi:MAG: nitroreductase family protein [Eubacterium sp.]|nr:nitroreductase family protein [Eubacterium sp.]
MEVKDAIYGRRSVRKYKPQPLDQQDILDILEAGIMAPSAVNYQPWYFVAVRSPETLKEIKDIMQQAAATLDPILKERFPRHPQVVKDTKRFVGLLGDAPLCVMAFINKPDYKKADSTLIQSVSAAIENMLLMAFDKGIGSCWLTAPLETGMDQPLKERFAPEKGDMVAMLTFGYPDQEPAMPRRKTGRYEII